MYRNWQDDTSLASYYILKNGFLIVSLHFSGQKWFYYLDWEANEQVTDGHGQMNAFVHGF